MAVWLLSCVFVGVGVQVWKMCFGHFGCMVGLNLCGYVYGYLCILVVLVFGFVFLHFFGEVVKLCSLIMYVLFSIFIWLYWIITMPSMKNSGSYIWTCLFSCSPLSWVICLWKFLANMLSTITCAWECHQIKTRMIMIR